MDNTEGWRKCPICREFKLPPRGNIVCCQNNICEVVVDTDRNVVVGRFVDGKEIKYEESE